MDKNHRLALEAFLGVILIVFIILLIVLFLNIPSGSAKSSVSNSYNVNSYNSNSYNKETCCTPTKYVPVTKYVVKKEIQTKIIHTEYRRESKTKHCEWVYTDSEKRPLKFSHKKEIRTYRGAIGNYVDEYVVYVKNEDCVGGYFKVKYTFKDCTGKLKSYTFTEYIGPNSYKKFYYKDIYSDRYTHKFWNYQVIPDTKKTSSERVQKCYYK